MDDDPCSLGIPPCHRGGLYGFMSFEQLETVVAIADEGALVRAARRLHITQPPLTRRLQALEDELGVTLFERLPRGMRLTPAGGRFVDHARAILAAVDRAKDFEKCTNHPVES